MYLHHTKLNVAISGFVLKYCNDVQYPTPARRPFIGMSLSYEQSTCSADGGQVTWCWILGAAMCFTLGASIAEIVSAYPTCGGL